MLLGRAYCRSFGGSREAGAELSIERFAILSATATIGVVGKTRHSPATVVAKYPYGNLCRR